MVAQKNDEQLNCSVPFDLANNRPCASMNVFLGLPDIDKHNIDYHSKSFIRIYLKSEVKVKSVIIYYDTSAFVADMGGYIGMFLGVSLIDFTMKCNEVLFKLFTVKMKQNYATSN